MSDRYTLKIEITSDDFSRIKKRAEALLEQISDASSFAELPLGAGGGGGLESFGVTLQSPRKAMIADLRAEADRMEAEYLREMEGGKL